MQVVVVGANHKSAPLALRERLAFTPDSLPGALARLRTRVPEGFILSTCNRTELYALVGHAESGALVLTELLAQHAGLASEALNGNLYTCAHSAAVRHLFAIAAGVDSMVLGDDQILAQLKAALERAHAAGAMGAVMHRLGQAAMAAGKEVRAQTAIGRNPVSIVSVALGVATARLGALGGRAVLVIGAGRIAELLLKHLASHAPATVTLMNRSEAGARELAMRYGVSARPWSAMTEEIAAADLVLSCTAAPTPVIDTPTVAAALRARTGSPLLLVDLAVPRDVDAAVATLPGVTLIDTDSLQAVCVENLRERAQELARAEAVIGVAVERFMAWWNARQLVPTITALLAHAREIQEAEVAQTLTRLPALSPYDVALVRRLVTRVVNKLLHQPLTTLKSDPEGANMALLLQRLFGLSPAVDDVGSLAPALPSRDEAGMPRASHGHRESSTELHGVGA